MSVRAKYLDLQTKRVESTQIFRNFQPAQKTFLRWLSTFRCARAGTYWQVP